MTDMPSGELREKLVALEKTLLVLAVHGYGVSEDVNPVVDEIMQLIEDTCNEVILLNMDQVMRIREKTEKHRSSLFAYKEVVFAQRANLARKLGKTKEDV